MLTGLVAVALGFAGAASFAFGSCHDAGGFCAPSFGTTHVLFYAVGTLLLSSAAGLLTVAVTARRRLAVGIAAVAVVVLLALAVVVETTA